MKNAKMKRKVKIVNVFFVLVSLFLISESVMAPEGEGIKTGNPIGFLEYPEIVNNQVISLKEVTVTAGSTATPIVAKGLEFPTSPSMKPVEEVPPPADQITGWIIGSSLMRGVFSSFVTIID